MTSVTLVQEKGVVEEGPAQDVKSVAGQVKSRKGMEKGEGWSHDTNETRLIFFPNTVSLCK